MRSPPPCAVRWPRKSGSALVFLPGIGEIRRVEERLDPSPESTWHRSMATSHRPTRTAPSPPRRPGRRKVVLATSIAETSLTIEGVRLVIDCGLMRVPRFSLRSGMTRWRPRA